MPPSAIPHEWELPKLRYSLNFEDDLRYVEDVGPDTEFFDVKFYPYSPTGSPVFAAVSKRYIFICRLNDTKDKDSNPCEVLQAIRDDDIGALNCSCTWAKDPETEHALLCVSGRDSKVKIYSARDGKAVGSLVGHGGEINDLATSPANPQLIASASDDTTVRIWSLDPVHKNQPCVCLLAGEGHSWNLLSVAFHDSGRYVLSAGHDQVINLWTLPDFPDEHMDTPIVVHYPHFSTSEIHTGLIDCVAFYGDLILSRACHEDVIVLWRIEGFSSDDPPPSADEAPSNHDTTKVTRSAFSSTALSQTTAQVPNTVSQQPQTQPLYTRLLQLHTPGCGPQFFMRFGLFHTTDHHPTLAFCNATAKIFFWDFACFAAYDAFMAACRRGDPNVSRPSWLRLVPPRRKAASSSTGGGAGAGGAAPTTSRRLRDMASEGPSDQRASAVPSVSTDPDKGTPVPVAAGPQPIGQKRETYNPETLEEWRHRYQVDDPHAQLKAHRTETTKGLPTVGRQVAWSPEGAWCVVVGSNSRILILHRWGEA